MPKRTARKEVSGSTRRLLATVPPVASIPVPVPPSPVLHHQVVTWAEFIPPRPILHWMGYFAPPARCVSNAGSLEPAIYPLGVLYQLSGIGVGRLSTINYYDEMVDTVRDGRVTFTPHLRFWGYYQLEYGYDESPWYYTDSIHGRMCYYRLTSSEVELMNVRLRERYEVRRHLDEYRTNYIEAFPETGDDTSSDGVTSEDESGH